MSKDYVPPEKKAEGEIVEKAESYAMQFWSISSPTYREFLAPFRAIQAEIDMLKERLDQQQERIRDKGHRISDLQGKLARHENEHRKAPKLWSKELETSFKKPDLATDKNGHDLRFGDVVSYLNYKEEKRFGIFHHEETGDIWAYWFRPFASELTGETTYMDKDCVTFEFRPEPPEQDC